MNLKELTDIELVELARLNSEEAKEELYERSKKVVSYSVRKCRFQCHGQLNQFDIEDVISECNIAVMEAIRLYNPDRGAAFIHFLKFTIRTRIYNFIESRIEQKDVVSIEAKVDEKTSIKAILAAPRTILDVIRDLTIKVNNDSEKRIVDLYLAGMVQSDIAREIGKTRAWVMKVIKRSIK